MSRTACIWIVCLLGLTGTLSAADIPACMLNYRFGPELHLLVVDKSAHSLLVYSNYSSEPVARYRVTTGKHPGQKQYEGDSKTPEGIYFFNRIISGANLPKSDDYGEKAFVTDYPNPIDRNARRSGSGIWLHGAHDPEKTTSPNNSRGCVVMKNEDLTQVSKYIYLNQTPLCIYEQVPYLSETEIASRREQLMARLSAWKQSWEERDIDAYIANYSPTYQIDGMSRAVFRRHKEQLNRQYRYIRILLNNLTLYAYSDYSIAIFNQVYISDLNHFHAHKIQYWGHGGASGYAIVAEDSRRLPAVERIEVDLGNWVTLDQYRAITEKKLVSGERSPLQTEAQTAPSIAAAAPAPAAATSFSYPGIQTIKSSPASNNTIELEIAFGETIGNWRYIPVLAAVKDNQTSYISQNGIHLRDGIPTNPEMGATLTGASQRFSLPLPNGALARSLTVFLVGADNRIRQIVTSILNP